MQKITPFLWFNNNAEEAMNFYVSVFNSSPEKLKESKVVSVKYYPEGITEGPMAGFDGKVLTGVYELEGNQFMALDGGPVFQPSGAMSLLIDCKNQEEIDHFWDSLSAVPEFEQCGWLKDKYGFVWQIAPDMSRWLNEKNKEGSDRATQAMLKMKKIIIKDLEKAYEG